MSQLVRLLLTVALIAATAVATVLNAVMATPVAQPQPVDSVLFGRAGGLLLTGHWGAVFSSSLIQAGPIELAFWGVPFLLGVSGLVGWIAFNIVVTALFSIAMGLIVESLLRGSMLRSNSPSGGRPSSRWNVPWSAMLAVGVTAIAAATGVLNDAVAAGHPAEIAIPLLWLIAAGLARSGRSLIAGAVLGASTGWELWGLLGVPVLLLAPRLDPRTVARSALGGVAAVAVVFLPFVLAEPFPMFDYRWTIQPHSLAHQVFPHLVTFSWPLRLGQAALSVAAGASVAWLLRRRLDAVWLAPLVVCVVRLATDPVFSAYYLVTPVLLIVVGAGFACRRFASH